MKKILYIFILIAFLLPILFINQNSSGIVYAETDNITGYRKNLAYINEHYSEQISNRIIVKTKYLIEDENAVYSASGFAGLNVFQYENEQAMQNALNYYSSLPYVDYAEQDIEIKIDDVITYSKNVAIEDMQYLSWGSDLLGISTYQNYIIENCGENLTELYVAVLDTGIDTNNEFLKGRIAYDLGISYYDSELYLSSSSDYPFEDDNSHGTHVAGTIVDLTLDNVKIIPIKVLNSSGSGSTANVISGIEYVLSLKNSGTNVCAFNMSLGGFGFSAEEEQAINNCYDANIMPVVAAGNDNYYAEDFTPSNCEKALTISALSQNEYYENFLYVADYSNYGEVIDLCLPGTDILSCVPDESTYNQIYTSSTGGKYAVISGTSMATPHATALVALYATFYGEQYDVGVIETKIKENTYDYGDIGKDDLYGYGVPSLSLAIDEFELISTPTLNYGSVNSSYNFNDSLEIEIYNNNSPLANYNYKIYYTLDGSYPTLINYLEYTNPISINQSTLLRFVIYLFDSEGNICGDSKLYEITYFKGNKSVNDDGTGFTITEDGMITSYNSGIRDIVMPKYINGVKVRGLQQNLFYGLNITSFVCDYDISIGYYPFVSCDSLKSITLYSSEVEYLAKYCFSLKELNLPNATEIKEGILSSSSMFGFYGSQTFVGCFNLETLNAPKIIEIKDNVFSGFKKLKNLNINWNNLYSIGQFAFENCASLNIDIILNNVSSIGKYAFYSSGIKSFYAENLEVLYDSTFNSCKNLQNIILPNIKTIYSYAIYGCDNLNFVFLGDNNLQLVSDSLQSSYFSNFTIYCYDTQYVSNFTDKTVVNVNPSIEEIESQNIDVKITGYDLSLKIYRSSDEILSSDDFLITATNFNSLNIDENFNFDYLSFGNNYYIITLLDRYDNCETLVVNKTGTADMFDIVINCNINNFGLSSSSFCYFANENVEFKLGEVKGYKLTTFTIDNEDVLNDFVDGKYSFVMPSRDVVINLYYTKINYTISLNIVGDGSASVLNENGQEIASANYQQNITLNYTSSTSYLSKLYYITDTNIITNLDINQTTTTFSMPAENIEIYIEFKQLSLSDFIVFFDYSQNTFSLSSYTGTDTIIKIPQYVTKLGVEYRLNKINDFCFYNNQTLKQIEVDFVDEIRNIEIGEYAFSGCVNLEYVNIGKITKVLDCAFEKCSNLISIDLSSCVSVSKWAFYECYNLISADLQSCIELLDYAFASCSSLKTVKLSDDLTCIPNSVFQSCSSLESINLSKVEKIGASAFWYCKSLTVIDLSSLKEFYSSNQFEPSNSFYMCISLTDVIGSENIKIIPEFTFGNCYNLINFDFSNCEELYGFSFSSNNKLDYINLTNIKKIEGYPFISASAKRFIFGNNEYLLTSSDLEISHGIYYVYVDKSYTAQIGSYISKNFSYSYDLDNYKVYTRLSSSYVTFKLDNGTIIGKEIYSYGTNIKFPSTFKDVAYSYNFIDWINEKTSEIVNPNEENYTYNDVTFVANNYTKSYVDYKVIFYYGYDYDNSGTVNDVGDIFYSTTYHYGDTIQALDILPLKNADVQFVYSFNCWSYNDENYNNNSLPQVVGNMEFFAVYNSTLQKYTISWYSGNTLLYQEEIAYGTTPQFNSSIIIEKLSLDPLNYYYTFSGWSPVVSSVVSDCDYYAQFQTNYYYYVINYYYGYDYDNSGIENDDGDLYISKTYNYYDLIENVNFDYTYTNQGIKYTFKKWNVSFDNNATIYDIFPLFSADKILNIYAQYDEKTILYSIRWFDGQGELIYTDNLTYGMLPVYDTKTYGVPTKHSTNYNYYTFTNWDKEVVEVTQNADYYAEFEEFVRLYEIKWLNGNGEIIYVENLPYESKIEYDELTYNTPTKDSTNYYKYEFIKWTNLDDNDVVLGDRTILSEFIAYNIVNSVDDNYQIVDVSPLTAIKSVLIKTEDIINNGKLEIKFNNVSILIDDNNLFNSSEVLKLNVDLNYNTNTKNNFTNLWSFNIEMYLDDNKITSFDNDILINLNCITNENAELMLNNVEQNYTLQNSNSLSFSTNQLGEFVYGYKNANSVLIVILSIIGSLVVIGTISVLIIIKNRKKKIINL